jgi:hypothetical protein
MGLASLALVLGALGRADTFIYLDSQPGDYIGLGVQRTLRPGTLNAIVQSSQVLTLNYANGLTSLRMEFDGTTQQPLGVGEFEGATRYPFNSPSNPGLDVSADSRGCNTITGEFVIRELETDRAGNVTKLALDFEQYCDSYSSHCSGRPDQQRHRHRRHRW